MVKHVIKLCFDKVLRKNSVKKTTIGRITIIKLDMVANAHSRCCGQTQNPKSFLETPQLLNKRKS